jgi:hypothetical protein
VGFCKSVGQCDKNCCKQSKYPDVIFFHDVHSFKFISDKIIKSVYKSNYELTDFGKDPPIDTQSLFNKVSPHSFGLWLVVAN